MPSGSWSPMILMKRAPSAKVSLNSVTLGSMSLQGPHQVVEKLNTSTPPSPVLAIASSMNASPSHLCTAAKEDIPAALLPLLAAITGPRARGAEAKARLPNRTTAARHAAAQGTSSSNAAAGREATNRWEERPPCGMAGLGPPALWGRAACTRATTASSRWRPGLQDPW
eukprot:CAMPEP_0179159272 /NCGR_PEP_ID=MMETSP0796-20121207/77773_1 /TAXON_ID=73915 /ORGANISM="Pyrodinium bahamense, Strain pbaha01" /LENGTH=168 /DNA_ID=CAMNT_0020861035 /DNA_START=263 /DNA_END=766 /DNA_ORIENTATION=-